MATVNVYNKERGITYVYESESYWDKELKQPRSHRKLIGKLDPETGNVVPTGTRGRKKATTTSTPSTSRHSDTDYKVLYEKCLSDIDKKDAIISELRASLNNIKAENRRLSSSIQKAQSILASASEGLR